MKTSKNKSKKSLKNKEVKRIFFAIILCTILGFSTQKINAQLNGSKVILPSDFSDVLEINSDNSKDDSGIRLNTKVGDLYKDWILYNSRSNGRLHIGYYRSENSPSYSSLTGSPVMSFESNASIPKIWLNGKTTFNEHSLFKGTATFDEAISFFGENTFHKKTTFNKHVFFNNEYVEINGFTNFKNQAYFFEETTFDKELVIHNGLKLAPAGGSSIIKASNQLRLISGVGSTEDDIVFSQDKDGLIVDALRIYADGNLSMNDKEVKNLRGLRLKDWDDNTGGLDDKYRYVARDGAHMFYKGGVAVGTFDNGTWDDVPDGRLIVQKDMVIGDTELVPNTVLTVDGRVHISPEGGTETPFNVENFGDFLLWVEKGIVAADLAFGTPDEWEDRVFKADYILPSLREVESHINLFGHLPNFPSEKEIVAKGYSAHDMNKRFMRTLEELNLYAIAQDKKIAVQDKKLKNKEQNIEQLQNTTKAQQQLIEQLSQRLAQLEAKVQE